MSEQECLKADPQICVQIFEGKFPRETRKVVGGVRGAGRGRSQVSVQAHRCTEGRFCLQCRQTYELCKSSLRVVRTRGKETRIFTLTHPSIIGHVVSGTLVSLFVWVKETQRLALQERGRILAVGSEAIRHVTLSTLRT